MSHPTGDDLLTSLKFNAIVTAFLFFKMHYCFLYLGVARIASGTRAPEDTYQKKPTAAELEQALQDKERATRMSANDIENILPFLFLMWGGYLCLATGSPTGTWIHNIGVTAFAFGRLIHTFSYAQGISKLRTAGYALGQVSCIVLVVNMLSVVFNKHS